MGFFRVGNESDESDSDCDEPEVKKVALKPEGNAKKYRCSKLETIVQDLRRCTETNDFVSLRDGFERLIKQLRKFLVSPSATSPPRAYIQGLVLLQDHISKTQAKNLKGLNLKALNYLKQKVKKECKSYEETILWYRENEQGESSEASGGHEDSETEDSDLEDIWEIWPLVDDQEESNLGLLASQEPQQSSNQDLHEHGDQNTDECEKQLSVSMARSPAQKLSILLQAVAAELDTFSLRAATWRKCANIMLVVFDILELHPEYILVSNADEFRRDSDITGPVHIAGNLAGYVSRLDDELSKIWQTVELHSNEYVELLKNEDLLILVAENAQSYLEHIGDTRAAAGVARCRLEHLYYRPEEIFEGMLKVQPGNTANKSDPEAAIPADSIVDKLVTVVEAYGDERDKFRAAVCKVYNLALSGKFQEAMDLLFERRLQDSMQSQDISSIVLYNRAVTQIGLSAFWSGLFEEAHKCLCELCSSGNRRKKVLLGQVGVRFQDQKTEAWMKQVFPFHMHFNLELLEATHLVSAMLLDVPNMVAAKASSKARPCCICKAFTDNFEAKAGKEQHLFGPPETSRDYILAASRSLRDGDWEQAFNLIANMTIWKSDPVLKFLKNRIQQAALKCSMFTNCSRFSSLDIETLATRFQLPGAEVRKVICGLIVNQELEARIKGDFILPQGATLTKLQSLASKLPGKLWCLVDQKKNASEDRQSSRL